MEGIGLGATGDRLLQRDPQRLVEGCDRIGAVGAVIDAFFNVLAFDDPPVPRLEDGMMHEGPAPGLAQVADIAIGKGHGRIGQRQAADALLRTGRPAMDAGIIVDAEILDAQRRHRIHQSHRVMAHAGVGKAPQVVDPARTGFPMRHRGPFRLVFRQGGLDHVGGDGLAMRHSHDLDRGGLRVHRACGQFLGGGCLHPQRQPVDPRECAVDEDHHPVARHDGTEQAVEPAPPCSGNAEGMDVPGSHHLAQHQLAFDHAAQDIGLHMVRHACAGKAVENTRVGVSRSRPRRDGVWNFQLREDGRFGHGVSSRSGFLMLRKAIVDRGHNVTICCFRVSKWVGNYPPNRF